MINNGKYLDKNFSNSGKGEKLQDIKLSIKEDINSNKKTLHQ